MIPYTKSVHLPRPKVGSFAENIRTDDCTDCRIALLGLPDDTGVSLNGGRSDAANGPKAFREALACFGKDYDSYCNRSLSIKVYDAGDVEVAPGNDENALLETHRRVKVATEAIHRSGMLTVCIGGGHDLSLPSISGFSATLSEAETPIGGINLDAHLDVRDTIGSGMPFRFLIEQGILDPNRFVELGIAPFSNSYTHIEWSKKMNITLVRVESILSGTYCIDNAFEKAFPNSNQSATGMVTICLDAIDASQAPGVSALNPLGLPVATALKLARTAGKHKAVRHFDIMELAPLYDMEMRTAQVAVLLFLGFISGYCER